MAASDPTASPTSISAPDKTSQPDVLMLPRLALLIAVLLGGYVRLFPVFTADFPINDGGLFYLMTQELQRTHGSLPQFVSYNGVQIPFAYPPFSFYLLAAVANVTNWPLIDLLRVLPALFSVLTIPAFYAFCRALRCSPLQTAVAVLAFALLPRTYEVLIIGGGITRAPGFLWVLLTLQQFTLLYQRGERKFLLGAILFGSLTVLTHPTVIWLAFYSTALLFLFFGRSRRALLHSLVAGIGIVVLTSPWWFLVMNRHGVATFIAASQTKQYDWSPWMPLIVFNFTGEWSLPMLSALGLLGVIAALSRRRYFLPVWLVAMFFLQPRGVAVYATIPLALLVGFAVDELLLPPLRRLQQMALDDQDAAVKQGAATKKESAALADKFTLLHPPARFLTGTAAVYLLLYSCLGAFIFSMELLQKHTLSRGERTALQWVATHSTNDSQFLVLTGNEVWEDKTSEWFPVLAQRPSVATLQGYEWLPKGQFSLRWQQLEDLQQCVGRDAACLASWSVAAKRTYSHVYVCKTDGEKSARHSDLEVLRSSLRGDPAYHVVYDGPGATIFSYKPSAR